jgi:hypothetical protein
MNTTTEQSIAFQTDYIDEAYASLVENAHSDSFAGSR